MTLPAQDIVDRLRGIPINWVDLRLGNEAADRIEADADTISRLTADNEALRDALSLANQRGDAWKNRAEAAEARAGALAQEVERLREALKDIVLGGDPEPGDPMADQIQGAVLDIVRAALANEEAGG